MADQAEVRPQISWADLMILAGNVALETMGFKTFGFAAAAPMSGSPTRTSTGATRRPGSADQRYSGDRDLENPLAAVQMGLIYVNPEGPNGQPRPGGRGADIRETFGPHGDGRRGDGGADRRWPHLRQDARRGTGPDVGADPEAADLEQQAWAGTKPHGTGVGADAITSGLEVTWTTTPTWSANFF